MSSIVKKSTHFTPKLRKKPIKKKVEKPQLTPPATQEHAKDQEQSITAETTPVPTQIGLSPASTQAPASDGAVPTPEPTQAEPKTSQAAVSSPLKAFNFKVVPSQEDAEDVDPIDSSKKLDHPDSGSEKYDSDNDIFKEIPRRKSVQQRRLSGITPILNRNRSTSISMASGGSIGSEASEDYTPAKIGIPSAKAVKRRRSSAHTRNISKRASVIKAASISIPKDPSPVPEEDQPSIDGSSKMLIKGGEGEYVVGIDPKTKRLSKFRLRASPETPGEDDQEEIDELKLAPDNLITSITSVSQLPRAIKGEDEELYRDIGFDINEMTMADLCKPTLPIGKVSSNYESVKAAEEKIKQKKEMRRKHRERARVERVPLEEILAKNGEIDDTEEMKKKRDELLNADAPEQTQSSNLQVMLVDGKIGFDADSAIVSRHKGVDNSHLSREESNPFENPITSSSYSKRKHTDRWTQDEVQQFYSALSAFGTDFLLISQLFPYRTRKQIKSKFNLEEKNYPEIVEMALKRKLPADFKEYCEASKHDIKSLEYYNNKLRDVRIAHEEELAAMALERERALKDDAEKNRQREIEFRTGAKSMTRAEKIKELRKNEMVVGSIDTKSQQPETPDVKPAV